jgi:CDP-paratose 2-epimerase
MRILITGICGFVGSTLARARADAGVGHTVFGVDNRIRPGSETNRGVLRRLGATVFHRDIRLASDFESLPPVDWVVDAAANPSVLAGVDGRTNSRQPIEHNQIETAALFFAFAAIPYGLDLLDPHPPWRAAVLCAVFGTIASLQKVTTGAPVLLVLGCVWLIQWILINKAIQGNAP